MRRTLVVAALAYPFALAACGGGGSDQGAPASTQPAAGAPAAGAAAGGSASVSGKVKFEGAPPAAETIKTSADPKCHEMHKGGLQRQQVEVKDGGLKDALVYVKNAPAGGAAPADAAVLDQEGCMYKPAFLAVRAGQPIKIRNSDDTLHNIHPRPTVNDEFNIGQPRKGMETTRTFDKKEVLIPVGCDVHPWMRSYISVLDHPYFAVTDDDGDFEIKNLPAGDWEIEVRHPKAQPMTHKVTVKDGESAKADVTVKG
jgi:plastocyanin